MAKGNMRDGETIITNDVLRGKPYLDIDRVITKETDGRHSNDLKND